MPASKDDDDVEVVRISGAAGANKGEREVELPDDDVEVIDDTPEADRGRKPLERPVEDPDDEELSQYSAGVKKRFSELTHARHDERRAREAAERQLAEAVNAANTLLAKNRELQQRTTTGETHMVASAKAAAEAQLEAARKDVKAAKEAFDPDAEMAAQEKMLEAKITLRELGRYRAPVQPQEEVVQLPPAKANDTPVDQKTLRWQAKNQWFGTEGNEEMTSFALGLHQKLVRERIDPRSDEYFEKVDGRLREVFPDFFGSDNGAAGERPTPRTQRTTSPVSPAVRSVNGVTKVRLTQSQLALAKKFGLTPQQYAQEVARLEQK